MKTAIIATAGAIVLASCASSPPRPQDLIPVWLVTNSVKCGLALALEKERTLPPAYQRLRGNVATVQLKLKVARTNTVGANAGGSGIVAFGGTIAPSLSFSSSQAWTVDTTLNSSYKLDASNAAVCKAANLDPGSADGPADMFGFSQWLSDLLVDLSKVSLEKPTGQLAKITYDATVGVTTEGKGGVTLKLAYFDAGVSAASTRVDTQQLTVVISGAPIKPPAADKPEPRSGGLGPMMTAPNLSTIRPDI